MITRRTVMEVEMRLNLIGLIPNLIVLSEHWNCIKEFGAPEVFSIVLYISFCYCRRLMILLVITSDRAYLPVGHIFLKRKSSQ